MRYFLYACGIEAYFVPAENLLPAWHSFALHPQLYAAICSQNFVNPTPIQSQAIPKALSRRDVIGVAETVSDYHHFLRVTSRFHWFLGLWENSRLWATHSSRTPRVCLYFATQNEISSSLACSGSRTYP